MIANAVALYVVPAFLALYQTTCRYFFAYGGRGGAKSIAFTDYIINECARRRIRVLCTREVQKSIKESVHALIRERILAQGRENEFRITETSIIHKKTRSEIIFAGLKDHTADSIKSYTGINICWVEEAHSVTKKSWDILIPTIRAEGSKILISYNRFMENDPCHAIAMAQTTEKKLMKYTDPTTGKEYTWTSFTGEHAHGVFINGYSGNPKFPEVLRLDMESCRINDPESFDHVWLGEPIGEEEFACIPRDKILSAMGRKIDKYPKGTEARYVLGIDVARMGLDRTVFYLTQRIGEDTYRYKTFRTYKKQDLVTTAEEVRDLINSYGLRNFQIEINIDDTGVGGGLTDILRKDGYKVNAINFGERAFYPKKYDNISSEMWFRMNEVLETSTLPDHEHLRAELSGRQWAMDNKQRRCIEAKKIFKKRYGKSPDFADACVLAHYDKKSLKKSKSSFLAAGLKAY